MKEKLNLLKLAENEMRSISGGYGDQGSSCNGLWESCGEDGNLGNGLFANGSAAQKVNPAPRPPRPR